MLIKLPIASAARLNVNYGVGVILRENLDFFRNHLFFEELRVGAMQLKINN